MHTDGPGRIAWGGAPRDRRDLWIPILRAAPSGVVRVVSLADRAELVRIHFRDGRTYPHLEPVSTCEHCEKGSTPRLTAYLAGWLPDKCRTVIAEIPSQCVIDNWDSLNGAGLGLRGMKISLARRGKAKNAPVVMQVESWTGSTADLPKCPDTRAALCRVWGIIDPREESH